MQNLKNETLKVLREHGKTARDIFWVGTSGTVIPLDAFWKEADNIYDNGYGGPEVNDGLLIVGDNWWLERHEYDGSEWWEYKEHPSKPLFTETEDIQHIIFPYPWYEREREV